MFYRKLRLMMIFVSLTAALGSLAPAATAQELPPNDILKAIFPNGATPQRPNEQIEIHFEKDRDVTGSDGMCGLQPVRLIETKGDESHSFSLLADPAEAVTSGPSTFLVRLNRVTVDIDGSGRAYHPEDPAGVGICTESRRHGSTWLQGACALAPLSSAEVRVFRGTDHLKIFEDGKSNPNFESTWSDLWTSIKNRQLRRSDLKEFLGQESAETTALFYQKEKNATVVFDTKIIPFLNNYPCVHERGRYQGYLVAATTLKLSQAGSKTNACDASQFLDALNVPFVVIPTGVFNNVAVGDIAVGYARVGQADRIAYGIVGDTGPVGKIGEASVAFINRLLKLQSEPMNAKATNKLDIDLENPEPENKDVGSIAMLVIGNTAKMLAGDYSAKNIEKVGKRALARWSAAIGPRRLSSCAAVATANRLMGAVD
jgi:hypothetical protein